MTIESSAYINFDLFVHARQTGYAARVMLGTMGEATAVFDPIPGGAELLSTEELSPEQMQQWGQRLFSTIFSGQVLTLWRTALGRAEAESMRLRLRLHLADVPELALWPWECLYDDVLDRYLALSVHTPVVRYLDAPLGVERLDAVEPLRMMVVLSSPQDLESLDVETEWHHLQNGLEPLVQSGHVELVRMPDATLATVRRGLRNEEFHMVHFIGHGVFDPDSGTGSLLLEDHERQHVAVGAERMGTLFSDHASLRLVVLNACDGGRGAASDPFAGVAQTMIRQGIPAVVAMRSLVTDDAAILLTNELYSAITDGYPVDAAVTEARRALYLEGYDTEWMTPVLYLRALDGRLFSGPDATDDAEPPSEGGGKNGENSGGDNGGSNGGGVHINIEGSELRDSPITVGRHGTGRAMGESQPPASEPPLSEGFPTNGKATPVVTGESNRPYISWFVNRETEQGHFDAMLTNRTPKRIMLVRAPEKAGKTWFVLRVRHECRLRNIPVAHFDFRERLPPDYLTLMREARDDTVPAAFNHMTQVINTLTGSPSITVEQLNATVNISNSQLDASAIEVGVTDMVSDDFNFVQAPNESTRRLIEARITDAFFDCLAALARKQPVVFLFDSTEKITPEAEQWLLSELLRRIRDEQLPNVLVVMAGRNVPDFDKTWQHVVGRTKLFPFEESHVRQYIEKRGLMHLLEKEKFVEFILMTGGKEPMKLANMIEDARLNTMDVDEEDDWGF